MAPFWQNDRNDLKFDENGTWIPVFPKVEYGTEINRFHISHILPSCIFKQKYQTQNPVKNRVKMLEMGPKMVEF